MFKKNIEFRNSVLLDPDNEWIKDACTGLFRSRNSIYVEFYKNSTKSRYILSRFIMKPAAGLVVDHINGDIFDNRRANLRVCTQAQNLLNKRSTKPLRGVRLDTRTVGPKKWQAYASVGGSFKSLGYFATEAARARDEYVRGVHGEFKRLNFQAQENQRRQA